MRAVEEAGFVKEMVWSESNVGCTAILDEDRVGRFAGGLGLVTVLSLGRGGFGSEMMSGGGCWRPLVIGDIGVEDGGEVSSGEGARFGDVVVDCCGGGGFVARGLRRELVRLGGTKAVSWRVDGSLVAFKVSWLWYLRRGKSCIVGPGASSVSSSVCCPGPEGIRGRSKLLSRL